MITRFMVFGITGWCMEIMWTGLSSLLKRDFRLTGSTSIWMFFIYGLAAFMGPLCDALNRVNAHVVLRGIAYMLCIFITEYAAGRLLNLRGLCPWDYSGARFAVQGIIRLDYAPLWFGAGLVFEKIYFRLSSIAH